MKSLHRTPSAADNQDESGDRRTTVSIGLEALDAAQVLAIDRAVRQVGEYGEIHLIVKRGQVRFIGTLKTEAIGTDA